MRVDFWFHPGCPWTWVTSRWLVEVAPHRDLDIHWRSFSLTLLNGCADVPRQWRERARGAPDASRVGAGAPGPGPPPPALGPPSPPPARAPGRGRAPPPRPPPPPPPR